ncbi:MAG: hypothetical protein LRY66_12695 [Saccharospirillaceae bacterium]|nr:hypothetical protein [Saccharospirillaceae bacterium]MCD8532176.1 hypothetical protein [Saccharospirillaceae bacterium]
MDKILGVEIDSGDQELALALILRLLGEYLNAPDTQISAGALSPSPTNDLLTTRAYADAMAKQYCRSGLDMSDLADKATAKSSQIKKNRQITKKPFVLFLCQQPDSQNLRRLQQILLIALYQHSQKFGSKARLGQALTSFRLLCDHYRARSSLSKEKILSGTCICIGTAHELLKELIKNESSDSARRYSQSIHRIVADVIDGELGNPRTGGQQKQEADEQKRDTERPAVLQVTKPSKADDEAPATRLMQDSPKLKPEYQDTKEYLSDNRSHRTYGEISSASNDPSWVKHSVYLKMVKARTASAQIERREKNLACSWNRLTTHELRIFLIELHKTETLSPAARWVLLLMLMTGRSCERIMATSFVTKMPERAGDFILRTGSTIQWVYQPDLPKHKLEQAYEEMLVRDNHPITLALPASLAAIPDKSELNELLLPQIEQWLKALNDEFETRLTIGRVADYLQNYLVFTGTDSVEIGLITGELSVHEAGTYYYQYDVTQVSAIHSEYLTRIDRLVPAEIAASLIAPGISVDKNIDTNKKLGGSQLQVKPEAIAGLFNRISTSVQEALRHRQTAKLHNRYTLYVLHYLNLCTGHRPVKDPYDDLNAFDLNTGKLFISDKEARAGESSRVVSLSESAALQISYYLKHLNELAVFLDPIDRSISGSIRETLAGRQPIFFFFDENRDGYQRIAVQPRSLHNQLNGMFNLPLNWHRHFLRTFLVKLFPGEVVDSFMGHASLGKEGLTKFSGMSFKQLKAMASAIDHELIQLKILPITGLNRHGKR